MSWVDSYDRFWLFGGVGFATTYQSSKSENFQKFPKK